MSLYNCIFFKFTIVLKKKIIFIKVLNFREKKLKFTKIRSQKNKVDQKPNKNNDRAVDYSKLIFI